MPATRLTIRDVDEDLLRGLRAISEAVGESLNATVLRILRDAVEVGAGRQCLLRFATWTQEEADEFDAVLREMRVVDPKMWK